MQSTARSSGDNRGAAEHSEEDAEHTWSEDHSRWNYHIMIIMDPLLPLLPDKDLMKHRATSAQQRSAVGVVLQKRMRKRLPECLWSNAKIPFEFATYIELMQAPRKRNSDGSGTITSLLLSFPSRWRVRLPDRHLDASCLTPLAWSMDDDDPDYDPNDPVAHYCGYYQSRWMTEMCVNDGSRRRRACSICEILCCEESCMPTGRTVHS